MPPPPPPAELGGAPVSSLLEALPGIASVLRSPVADALVRAIRAAAGVGEFTLDDAEELVRYAVRRGLIGPDEGDRVLADVEGPLKAKGGRRPAHPTKQRASRARRRRSSRPTCSGRASWGAARSKRAATTTRSPPTTTSRRDIRAPGASRRYAPGPSWRCGPERSRPPGRRSRVRRNWHSNLHRRPPSPCSQSRFRATRATSRCRAGSPS